MKFMKISIKSIFHKFHIKFDGARNICTLVVLCCLLIIFANRLDPDQAHQYVSKVILSWYSRNVNIQLCNHQFSKMLVLQIKFDDRAVLLIYTICHIVSEILTLIGNLTCCKEAKTMGA